MPKLNVGVDATNYSMMLTFDSDNPPTHHEVHMGLASIIAKAEKIMEKGWYRDGMRVVDITPQPKGL